jgi:tripartite-type tricarboxylate transporter receptor subunit TctC
VLNLQDVKDRFAGLGVESVPSTQAQFAQSIKSEIAKYAKLIKDVGIRID